MEPKQLRVLLANDSPILRIELGSALASNDEITLVATVADGSDALGQLGRHIVDVALLDVDMPVLDGVATARAIAAQHPDVTVVMLTAFEREDFLEQSLLAGASGFLTKDLPLKELVILLQHAASGKTVMGARPTALLAQSYREQARRKETSSDFIATVQAMPLRLKEVFDLLVAAASNRDIAHELHLSESTVRGYVSEILRLTGSRSRTEVAARALSSGLPDQALGLRPAAPGRPARGTRCVAATRRPGPASPR